MNLGIEEMFINLVQRMLDKSEEQNAANKTLLSRQSSQRGTVFVAENDEQTENTANVSKSCCSSG